MKIDSGSVYVGMGVVGVIAGGLGIWRRRLSRVLAACIAAFLLFELPCLFVRAPLLESAWWLVHMPSATALGVDEIVERHGVVVITVFHLGDFFLWSAIITAAFWFSARRSRHEPIS